ncbi:acyl-CoA thioesterase [Jatrophihabitans endophyticus]|uniref:acyl-CoA thioesterase n=1 Tax=Jatrophihabitans endophyticus TaxID=1206085 RepID=UPI001F3E1125|nr:acyl-CoA thioesterase domain-containing protein [Jatrophihabitans endophyticus]
MTSDPGSVTRRFDDGDVDLLSLLDLERVDADLFRADCVFVEQWDERIGAPASLYGGQVAAQALRAAGATVDRERVPHSLHGYFLRRGDARVPTVYKVERDRDGGSFSARRVAAVQNGEVVFTMSASFQVPDGQPVDQVERMPTVERPERLPETGLYRLVSTTGRLPAAPFGDRPAYPTRFWARVTQPLPPDPLLHACALTYLSDISTGVLPSPDRTLAPGASVDHAVWFHTGVDMNDWVLTDYVPRITGHGRGWYTGSLFDPAGTLVASVAQEALFRAVARP